MNPRIINVADIVEANGKTVRENNMELQHKIPLDSLVEVKYDKWHGNGASEKIHARLYVVQHSRDCDGTPMYTLSGWKHESINSLLSEYGAPIMEKSSSDKLSKIADMFKFVAGFSEESLTVIEVTPDIMSGKDCLEWTEEEKFKN